MTDDEFGRTIIRTHKNPQNPYVIIDKRPFDDPKLSMQAKGLLGYMLTKPDGWKFYPAEIAKRCTDSLYVIRKIFKELMQAGYVIRYQSKNPDGSFGDWITIVLENPHLRENFNDSPRQPDCSFPHPVNCHTSNNDCSNKDPVREIFITNSHKDLNLNHDSKSNYKLELKQEVTLTSPPACADAAVASELVEPENVEDIMSRLNEFKTRFIKRYPNKLNLHIAQELLSYLPISIKTALEALDRQLQERADLGYRGISCDPWPPLEAWIKGAGWLTKYTAPKHEPAKQEMTGQPRKVSEKTFNYDSSGQKPALTGAASYQSIREKNPEYFVPISEPTEQQNQEYTRKIGDIKKMLAS